MKRLLVQRLGREPGPEEIAEHMEIPLDKLQKGLKLVKEPISLKTPLGDFVEDQLAPSPVEGGDPGQSRRAGTQGIGDADATRRDGGRNE